MSLSKEFNEILDTSKENFAKFRKSLEVNSSLSTENTYGKKYDVGIKTLPSQTQSIKAKNGATLNLLLVGQAGLGKTTFINTLFGASLLPSIWQTVDGARPNTVFPKKTDITQQSLYLVENGFELDLNVISTPGFCDSIDNQFSYVPITEYIGQQLRLHVFQEEQPDRSRLSDNRIHVCLYFINPTSKGLSTSDIEALRHISNGVNLIPVIAKADTLTLDELRELKILIRQIIEVQDIKICEHIEDEQVRSKILEHVPYSVIGSESYVLREDGKSVRGRKYHWGIAEVDNEDHCDFTKLKDTLLSTNMIDLICSTESYYQRCRVKLLKARIHEARDKLKDGELLKGFDFEDIDKNGLRNYQVLSKINKSFVDDLAIEWNPIFIQRQLAQRKKFNEIVEFEENKFKEWKKALFSKQNLMNQGIEQMRKEVKVLNEIVHDLQRPIVLKGVVSHSVEDECILDPPGSSSAVLIGVN